MKYTAVFLREPEGGYTVEVPALEGCVTYGETLAEALDMVRDAILLYLKSLRDDGKQPPPDMPQVSVVLDDKQEAMVLRVQVEEAAALA